MSRQQHGSSVCFKSEVSILFHFASHYKMPLVITCLTVNEHTYYSPSTEKKNRWKLFIIIKSYNKGCVKPPTITIGFHTLCVGMCEYVYVTTATAPCWFSSPLLGEKICCCLPKYIHPSISTPCIHLGKKLWCGFWCLIIVFRQT